MMFNFSEAVIKFAGKLDHIIRATFRAYSTKEIPAAKSRGPEAIVQKEPKTLTQQEITPPPRIYVSNNVKSKIRSCRQIGKSFETEKVPSQVEEGKLSEKSELECLVIKKGHVKNLVEMYDEISDTSRESFARVPEKKDWLKEASQEDSSPTTPYQNLHPKPSFRQDRGLNKIVTRPPKVASMSSIVGHHSVALGEAKLDHRITLFDESRGAYAEDSHGSENDGSYSRDHGAQRRIEGRTFWTMFCMPIW